MYANFTHKLLRLRCNVAVVMKNGNIKLKSFLNSRVDNPATIKYKKGILASLKLKAPLFSWPKDKLTLLSIINSYLAKIQIDKLEKADKNEQIEVIDELLGAAKKAMEEETSGKDLEDAKEKSANTTVEENADIQSDENSEEDSTSDESNKDNLSDAEGKEDNSIESAENAEDENATPSVEENASNTEEIENKDNSNPFGIDDDRPDYIDESEYADLPDQIYDIEDVNAKMLGNVVRILNYRYKVLRKIRALEDAKAPLEMVNTEVEKIAVYNIVLAKYLPIINKQRVVDTVNLKNATNLFDNVCTEGYEEVPTERNIESEIKRNKEEQDFDIVAALNYVGVGVDKDPTGTYYIKNNNNGNGIKYYIGKSEKSFALSKRACERFLDNFLNKPIEARKFITPGQVFISYINEAEKSLGINTRSATELNDLFGSMNSNRNAKAYFKDAIRRYSRNAEEWKNFQKLFEAEYYSNKESKDDATNRIHIKQQAKRLVIGEMFQEFLNEGDILTSEQLGISDYRIGDVSRDFGLDIDLDEIKVNKLRVERIEDYAFRIVSSIHSAYQDMKAFVQDIIDNYTVDYLRKEKIFLLQQDDQNEYITKKKEYEDLIEKLSYDKAKDSTQQIAYYQSQIDDLTQKIGSIEYRNAKDDLLKSKNNFRILLLNAKSQKELVKAEINEALSRAKDNKTKLSIDEKLEILKNVLTNAPEFAFSFDKGKVTYYTRHKVGEKAEKREEKLSDVDKIIELTSTKISDESHQKILEENKIREALKKSQKEERVKSVNAYINAYGSIVGNAGGVGGFSGFGGVDPNAMPKSPTFASGMTGGGVSVPSGAPIMFGADGMPANRNYSDNQNKSTASANDSKSNLGVLNNVGGSAPAMSNAPVQSSVGVDNSYGGSASNFGRGATGGNKGGNGDFGNVGADNYSKSNNSGNGGSNATAQVPSNANGIGGVSGISVLPGMMGMPINPGYMMPNMMNMQPQTPQFNRDYQPFDTFSDGVEPCVIPFVVGYENKGVTTYGNMLEDYATYDRYKFLLLTNNNILYTYLDTKKAQIQTPEQIVSDLHIRFVKNAMAKSGLSTQDGNLATFDYKADIRKFLSKYVPQNMLDIVISDYNDIVSSVNFPLLKDLIEHRFKGDLETYVPENIKENAKKSVQMIATIIKTILSDNSIRRTYEEYSSKMKQDYITSLIHKIESGDIPNAKVDNDIIQSRLTDYLSFSTKGQNVIIQDEDNKDSGFGTYPRSSYFKQKENADTNIKFGKILSFEQNEIVTTRNEDFGLQSNVTNLYGTLYKFNGGYNKLLLKLKPYYLTSGVKFMENIVDALREKINIKTTVLLDEEEKKPTVSLVKFASKEKEKREGNESVYDYDDERWYVRKGFVLDKVEIKEYALLLALGRKYALDKDKTALKEDFYKDNLLSLNKINDKFGDFPEDFRNMITQVIRNIMMMKCERYIDFITQLDKDNSLHFNKMLYINRMLMESNSFDRKTIEEKKETIESLESGFNTMSEDVFNPHPEIYSSIEELEHYENLYMYYALSELFEKYSEDNRIICDELREFFDTKKKELRNLLLSMIRNKDYMNGYEIEMAEYFELNTQNIRTLDDKPTVEKEEGVEEKQKARVKIKNIDVIFKGIFDGFEKATKGDKYKSMEDEVDKLYNILNLIGTLPSIDSDEKDLEIALPNNQTIMCNIKGFVQQYLFRYIVDKEHELGPFAYVVKELMEHEELNADIKDLEEVAEILNADELGINLFAKFSSINISNNGNIFKIGDNISTVVETVNRLKTPTDIQKALNRDVFYKEGVNSCQKCFEEYFNRRKVEKMD